jgi:heme-degrading monooxygenase HmoA
VSGVKINVLTVPPEMRETLEQRFAARAGAVESSDGFEWFELLRPVEGSDRYLVYTRWRDDASFEAWRAGQAHGGPGGGGPGGPSGGSPGGPGGGPGGPGGGSGGGGADGPGGGSPGGPGGGGQGPAASGAELWSFEVVQSAGPTG